MTRPALHLLAQDAEDMAVVSAMVQDGITCPADMVWDKKRHLFALMLNRFCWEKQDKGKAKPERVRTGMHIHSVLGVRMKNIPQKSKTALSLLAIMVEAAEKAGAKQAGQSHIRFIFSAQAELLLSVEGVNVVMQDVTAPWAAKSTPRHEGT